ncbi:PepSY domain-containing protein [Salinimonas sp. HHU 13199]|uniref:PepSY domain-containing protein n=1 Tax=Salinimonas profundi TaxID=2729140 RepID=A0ABR8LP17_9ALTE|nr:PepSY-associated TM helix domain-containing protein [Salinimonas profundi]MBD3586806.1 PepSY domain-containing protein [Salinimonas profundi]
MTIFSRKPALHAHQWMGVFLSAFLYLVCLSGTLVVFNQEFERWEQPQIAEFASVSAEAVSQALTTFVSNNKEETEHYHIVFPTSGIPRLVVENDHKAVFADQQGKLLETEAFPWSKMLLDLHYYLHLPSTFGMIFVSALGAVICMLVVSGVFAHKKLVKDALKWRRGGSGQAGRIDLHNRFGIWASPFHLIIGMTGVYFGMAGLILTLVAQLDHNGDKQAVMNDIFTPEPALTQQAGFPDVEKAITAFNDMETGHKPIFLTVHDVGTPQQFIEIYAQVTNKLIYSENYRFTSAGDFIETAHYDDGHWGKQLIYSIYRLHFGDFAGVPVKVLYFILGIMLTALCVSGMDIWLSKQGNPPRLSAVWGALVWGSVSALALTATAGLVFSIPLTAMFWLLLSMGCVISFVRPEFGRRRWLKICAMSVSLLIIGYGLRHLQAAMTPASLQINSLLIVFALWCWWRAGHVLYRR